MAEQDQKQPGNEDQAEEEVGTAVAATEVAGRHQEEAAQAPPADLTPEERVAYLEEELVGAREAVLRAQADAQNTSRRATQDLEKARKFALEHFTGELLPVVDNLERALEAAVAEDAAIAPIVEGVELTLKSFHDALGKFHIEAVNPEGEPFDPNVHQAMTMVENDAVEPNTVIAVMQKGYTLNGRLVRPAMVMVSKGSEKNG